MSVNESGSDEDNDEKPLGLYSNDKPLHNNSIIGDGDTNEADFKEVTTTKRVSFVTQNDYAKKIIL